MKPAGRKCEIEAAANMGVYHSHKRRLRCHKFTMTSIRTLNDTGDTVYQYVYRPVQVSTSVSCDAMQGKAAARTTTGANINASSLVKIICVQNGLRDLPREDV